MEGGRNAGMKRGRDVGMKMGKDAGMKTGADARAKGCRGGGTWGCRDEERRGCRDVGTRGSDPALRHHGAPHPPPSARTGCSWPCRRAGRWQQRPSAGPGCGGRCRRGGVPAGRRQPWAPRASPPLRGASSGLIPSWAAGPRAGAPPAGRGAARPLPPTSRGATDTGGLRSRVGSSCARLLGSCPQFSAWLGSAQPCWHGALPKILVRARAVESFSPSSRRGAPCCSPCVVCPPTRCFFQVLLDCSHPDPLAAPSRRSPGSRGMWGARVRSQALAPLRVGAGLATRGHSPSPGPRCHGSEGRPAPLVGCPELLLPRTWPPCNPRLLWELMAVFRDWVVNQRFWPKVPKAPGLPAALTRCSHARGCSRWSAMGGSLGGTRLGGVGCLGL